MLNRCQLRSRPSFACYIAFASLVVAITAAQAQTSRLPSFKTIDESGEKKTSKSLLVIKGDDDKDTTPSTSCLLWLPTIMCMGDEAHRNDNINTFFGTDKNLSYFGQIKSIYNGASNSATVSADIASLNFSRGFQVTAGTNIQAGSSGATNVSAGTIPTLSSAAAGQATQNMLYSGTIYASGLLPLLYYQPVSIAKAGGFGASLDLVAREGVDIQNFKSGTSVNATAPPSHTSVQIEGYMQYNSTNLGPSSSDFAGAIFIGGSYGYSYMSHGYARDYGFGSNVSNGMGQVSAGILISGVAKIAISRAFGPSQTYIDSTSMAQTTVNNFKAWSFGITYQSPPAK